MGNLLRSLVREVLAEAAKVTVPAWNRKFSWNVDKHASIDASAHKTERVAEQLRVALPSGEYSLSANYTDTGWFLTVDRFDQTSMFDEGWLEENALANATPTLPMMTRHVKARIKRAVTHALKASGLRHDIKVDVTLPLKGRELVAAYAREQAMWGMTTDAPTNAPPGDDPVANIPEMVSGLESPKQRANGTRVYHHIPTDTVYGTFADLENPPQLRYVRQIYDSGHELTGKMRGSQNAVLAQGVSPQAAAERIAKRIANVVKRSERNG